MLTKADLLAEINQDVPAGVERNAGAWAYLANCFEALKQTHSVCLREAL
jgi:hypothetical protein